MPRQRGHQVGLAGPRRTPDQPSPSTEETIRILEGIAQRFERHHQVHYAKDALGAAAQMAERYITDRRLPHKAVDLVDEARSRKHMRLTSIPKYVSALERARQLENPLAMKIVTGECPEQSRGQVHVRNELISFRVENATAGRIN